VAASLNEGDPRKTPTRYLPSLAILLISATAAILLAACSGEAAAGTSVTLYSGRLETLVGPLLNRFAQETGVNIRVRYGDTAELAAAILEEGANSPADVFFAQDAGALGALSQRGLLAALPENILNRVETRYRSPAGLWVGVSGRARVVAYNTQTVRPSDLPDSIFGFTDPAWRGKIGWAPTNASFQAFVTGLRVSQGDEAAKRWLEGIKANNPREYANNIAVVQAVGSGDVQVGFVNHYYLHAIQKDQGQIPVANYHPRDGDVGAMINVAGAGIVASSRNQEGARRLIEYLLTPDAQRYFSAETYEYPLVTGVEPPAGATPLSQIRTPNIDLGNLADLQGTLSLLRQTAVL
jgi:iron(III) transport system substrate-binding protein